MSTESDFDVSVGVKVYNATSTISEYSSAVYVATMDASAVDLVLAPITYLEDRAGNDIIDRADNILIARR